MSRYDPTAHIPKSNMSAYIGSTPKAPLDPGTAEFVKGKPALVEPASKTIKDVRYYRQRITALTTELEHNAKDYREAVAEFKSSGVWKEQYGTWGRTCRECIGISRQRGNELIRELTESYEEYNDKSGKPLSDTSEAHELERRMTLPDPLAELEAQMARPVVHAGPEPEPAEPKAEPVKPPEPPKDCMGYPIPKRCLELWEQRDDVQGYLTAASRLKCLMDELQVGCKPIYLPMQGNVQTHMTNLRTIHFHLSLCKPWAVCPICDGVGQAKGLLNGKKQPCSMCRQTGMVSEKAYTGDWTTGHSKAEREAILEERKHKCSH